MAKAPRKGGKGKAPAKSAKGKKPAAKKSAAKKPAAKPKPTRAPSGKGSYEITCSECYTTFQFRSTGANDITCPECMHTGTVADSAAMSDIAMAKSKETNGFRMAMIPVLLFFVVGLAYAYILTTKSIAEETIESSMHYGFLGGIALLFILVLAFGIKYESSRSDVYF